MTKPFVRPPLVITTEPTKHNFYLKFDPETGMVKGLIPKKEGNCVEIDEYLAHQIQKGTKTFFDLKVELQKKAKLFDDILLRWNDFQVRGAQRCATFVDL